MKIQNSPDARIFVCVNEKAPEKNQCLRGEGEKIVLWLREQVEKKGLKGRIHVTRSKCQNYCDPAGTALTFVPTGQQYSEVKLEDVPPLFEKFLQDLRDVAIL